MTIVSNYIRIPKQLSPEFWNMERIEHIRTLSETGKPVQIFNEQENSLRVLDKIRFVRHDTRISDSPLATLSFKLGDITMSSPLYLGDMSFGALSGNPNVALAAAADATETIAGTGEGGLHPDVAGYRRIFVQWASARFGVDAKVLSSGLGVVIKIGQGAKPGIGGHLPGKKVTEPISRTRRIPIGVDAISPAPHHDIYSIEDLGQRIEALKEASARPVFVKVAATNYAPYIVSGVARMGAAGVIIDGHGAGTGASPTVIRDNVGIPVELAVASADSVLRNDGRRKGFSIIAGGRVGDATDAAKLMALGADVVNVGTGALLSMGCVMVHKCHVGYCPTALTNRIDGTREIEKEFAYSMLVNYINGFSLEMANILDNLGLRSIRDIVGRKDLLMGNLLSGDILEVLGIRGVPADLDTKPGPLWGNRREYYHELVTKGQPVITSMGSTGPPDVSPPGRILDWIRCDGAQVTRPSIDPYREEIETAFYLMSGKLYTSMPVIIDIRDAEDDIAESLSWASGALSSLVLGDSTGSYEDVIISRDGEGVADWSSDHKDDAYMMVNSVNEAIDAIDSGNIAGIILDEDSSQEDLEVMVSELDTMLKKRGIRSKYDILAKSCTLRDSGDVFKMVALGADSVMISHKVFQTAIGEGNRDNLLEKAFNFLSGIRREIALLSGAAGIYSVQSSLTGNRELLRSINLDSRVSAKLRVKAAGAL